MMEFLRNLLLRKGGKAWSNSLTSNFSFICDTIQKLRRLAHVSLCFLFAHTIAEGLREMNRVES